MAFNSEEAFNLDLSLWGSKITDMDPADIPPGAMPNNGELMFLAGAYATRPAFVKNLSESINTIQGTSNLQIVSVADYPLPNGSFLTMFEDSAGTIWADPTATNEPPYAVAQATVGTYFRAVTAFGKIFFAFYSPTYAETFSDSPFVGVDVPKYYDGTNIWRVTTDSPGGGLSVTSVPIQSIDLQAGGSYAGTSSVVSIVPSGPVNYIVSNGGFGGGGGGGGGGDPTYYTSFTVTLVSGLSLIAGNIINLSGISWSPASPDGPQWASGVPILEVISSTQFTIAYVNGGYQTGTGGTASFNNAVGAVMSRTNNIVTASLLGTSPTNPTVYQVGWYVNPIDITAVAGATVPNPQITNELFQVMGGVSSFVGNGNGLVTVTTSTPINRFPVGSWFYYYTIQSVSGTPVSYVITASNTATITMSNGPTPSTQPVYPVGQLVQIQNSTIFGGNPVVQVTASTNTTFTFYWNAAASSGSFTTDTSLGGVAIIPEGTLYGGGYAQVTEIISSTSLQFFIPGNSVTGVATGYIYDFWGALNAAPAAPNTPAAGTTNVVMGNQIIAVNTASTPNTVSWFQFGPDNTYTGGDTIQLTPQTQTLGGPRSLVVFNYYENGAVSGVSNPIQYNGLGSNNYPVVTVPLGPPGTTARAVAWTPAYGSSYYALAPATIPATAGNAPIIVLGTIIYDNTTTNLTMDFSDQQLVASTALQVDSAGSDFGNLFNYTKLQPCMGVEQYQNRIGWWGQVNAIPNLLNMGFDGNYTPTANGLVGAQPLGWTADGNGTLVNASNTYLGFAYSMTQGYANTITQSAYQDYWGAPILLPAHSYTVRCLAQNTGSGIGSLVVDVYSPTAGILSTGSFPVTNIPRTQNWITFNLSGTIPNFVPVDTLLRIYLIDTVLGGSVIIDEVSLIDTISPILYNQIMWSYPYNEFVYDSELGLMGVPTSDTLTNMFELRPYFQIQTNNSLYQTNDNGGDPNTWPVTLYAHDCGCAGPNATAVGEGVAWWIGIHGLRSYWGQEPKKLSQYVDADFRNVNWDYAITCWAANDPVLREVRIGLPINNAQSPNVIEVMSYRMADSAYNVPDPIHVSPYSGKMICTDLCLKFTTWNWPCNAAKMCTRETANGLSEVMVFAGGNGELPGVGIGYGNLYVQDTVNYAPLNRNYTKWVCRDDDYGQIGLPATNPVPLLPAMGGQGMIAPVPILTNNLAQTYFWFDHMTEQAAQGVLGQHRKIYEFLSMHAVGVGYVIITPLSDSYNAPGWTLPITPLPFFDIGRDLEFALNHYADRMSFMIQTVPIPVSAGGDGVSAAIWVTHMVASGRKDAIFPVWGMGVVDNAISNPTWTGYIDGGTFVEEETPSTINGGSF